MAISSDLAERYAQWQSSDVDFSAVEVRKSGVNGCGVYATQPIKAGAAVCPVTGVLRPAKDVLAPGYDRRALQVEPDWYLEEAGNPDDFINHSCSPNLVFSEDGRSFIAARDIAEGEEVFFDYATAMFDGGWSIPCSCDSSACRGGIVGFSELSAEQKSRVVFKALPYIRRIYKESSL